MNSMTGFGAASDSSDGREISIELKSVNHRFLDVVLKLPKSVNYLENAFREQIGAALDRGHVELYINYRNQRSDAKVVAVDEELLKQYITAFETVKLHANLATHSEHSDIMHMQDVLVVTETEDDQQAVSKLASKVLAQALTNLQHMRQVEGAKLHDDIAMRLGNLKHTFAIIEQMAPTVTEQYAEKLRARVEELLHQVEVDETRLANEIAIFADRSNIDEEIARFHSHIGQFESALESSEPIGRKMDFVLQELNREVNTIGSKANNGEMTNAVLELKSELEKIREQVQNVE